MNQNRLPTVLALVCAATLSACSTSQPSTETFVWKGPVSRDEWLRLRNSNGDFDVTEGTGDSAEIRLTIERSNQYAPGAQVKVLKTSDGVLACVLFGEKNVCTSTKYDGGRSSLAGFLPFLRGRTSVSGSVVLPRGVKLDIESTNGDVTVAAASNAAIVTTTNGDIVVNKARGALTVKSTNGDVQIGVDSSGGDALIQTTNGDVEMSMPPTLDAALTMQTVNGTLEMGFPGNITTLTKKEIIAQIGKPGVKLTLQSTNGDLTLKPRTP